MTPYAYEIVDVFTTEALAGNALAVFPDARGLDTETMQRVAREFNLSETTFVFPPERAEHAASVRIFTPTMEMRFAGHPTIGTSFVLRRRGIVPRSAERFVLEEGIGDVPIRIEPGRPETIWLTTPPISFGATFAREACARALRLDVSDLLDIDPQLVTAGNPNIYIGVRDPESVDRAWIDLAGVRELHDGASRADCIFVFAPTPGGAYSRMFAPEHGVVEDPATGSATGPLAAYMMRHGLVDRGDGTRFTSEQGVKMQRRSLLHVHVRGDDGTLGIDVGGSSVHVASGEMLLPSDGTHARPWLAPVTLRSPHVTLEPLGQEHRDDLIEAVKDGELWKLWFTFVPEPENVGAEIERRLALQRAGAMLPFAVVLPDGRAVGMTTFMNVDAKNRHVEIGSTWYRASVQRSALNTACKLLLLRHAFETLACIAVDFHTHVRNVRSRAAIERLGAKLDGILRGNGIARDGSVRDTAVYSITAAEWPAVETRLRSYLDRSARVGS
jgi:PhzF family phenazine biosynthesis protein